MRAFDDPDTDLILLNTPIEEGGASITLTGRVAGNCVDFDFVLATPQDTQTFQFRGEVSGKQVIGEFTGTGPADCASAGTFQVEVSRHLW